MSEIMVSVYIPTFNHENYIVQALESVLMQRTQYEFEVLVGEDCSTDNTRQVLQAWEQEHPGVFQIFYREQNMFRSECTNGRDLRLRCKGKYVICLEGDDFWTDPEKLEKQVTFLENHPEYYAVAHNCIVVDADSKPNGEQYPECKDEEYTLHHYASGILPGQLTTMMRRNEELDEEFDKSLILKRVGPGDRNLYFSIACQGRIYCMQECMSAYRHITSGGSSFSATYRFTFEIEELAIRTRMEFAQKVGNEDAICCASVEYLMFIRYALRHKYLNKTEAKEAVNRVVHWYKYLPVILKRDFNRFVLHKVPNF